MEIIACNKCGQSPTLNPNLFIGCNHENCGQVPTGIFMITTQEEADKLAANDRSVVEKPDEHRSSDEKGVA